MVTPVRLLVLQNDASDPALRLGDWMQAAGATIEVIRTHLGEPVPTSVPEGIDGVLPMGGDMDCDDDANHPFLVDERKLLRDAIDSGTAVFAVCLGSQLLAHALGGTVERAAPGEIGLSRISPNAAAATDRLARHLPAVVPVGQYHRDEVTALPQGAVLLAGNAACRHQLWRFGERAWAVQGHPEVDGAVMADWLVDDPSLLRRVGLTATQAAADVAAAEAEIAAAWRPVAEEFVAVAAEGHRR